MTIERVPGRHPLPSYVVQHAFRFEADGEVLADVASLGLPLPAALRRAAPRRQLEWAVGRYGALLACRELGAAGVTRIGAKADRSPAWPPGLVGSITHRDGFVAVAMARRRDCAGLGIDSERRMDSNVVADIRGVVANAREQRLGRGYDETWFYTLLFSAKESFYKGVAPEVGRFFPFLDVELVTLGDGQFTLELLVELTPSFRRGDRFSGTFVSGRRRIHTALVLPPPAVPNIGRNDSAF